MCTIWLRTYRGRKVKHNYVKCTVMQIDGDFVTYTLKNEKTKKEGTFMMPTSNIENIWICESSPCFNKSMKNPAVK